MICAAPGNENWLCKEHDRKYIYDKKLKAFRLKKRGRTSRYTCGKFHKTEIKLTKIIEDLFGKKNVVTSFRPLWALSPKMVLYEYDIHVVGTNLLIEYNGIQHYERSKFFHKRKEDFAMQQLRDQYKQVLASYFGFDLEIFRYDEPIMKDYVQKRLQKWL